MKWTLSVSNGEIDWLTNVDNLLSDLVKYGLTDSHKDNLVVLERLKCRLLLICYQLRHLNVNLKFISKQITSKLNDELDISDKSCMEESTPKALLCKRGWPGWFDLIWLDYCGKVSSGNVGKQRKHDLEMIFSSGMLAGKRPKNTDESSTNSKCNASCFSVLAITMSNRATPLR